MSRIIREKRSWKKPLIGFGIGLAILGAFGGYEYYQTDLPDALRDSDQYLSKAKSYGFIMSQKEYDDWFRANDVDNAGNEILKYTDRNGFDPLAPSDLPSLISRLASMKHLVFRQDANIFIDDQTYGHEGLARMLVPQVTSYSGRPSEVPKRNVMDSFEESISSLRLAKLSLDQKTFSGASLCGQVRSRLSQGCLQYFAMLNSTARGRSILERAAKEVDFEIDFRPILANEYWIERQAIDYAFSHPLEMKRRNSDLIGAQMRKGFEDLPFEVRFCNFIPKFKDASISRLTKLFVDVYEGLPSDNGNYKLVDEQLVKLGSSKLKALSYIFINTRGYSFYGSTEELISHHMLCQVVAATKPGYDLTNGLPLKDHNRYDLDGKDLRLKNTPNGWILYSVGNDRIDDGGVNPVINGSTHIVDNVFKFPGYREPKMPATTGPRPGNGYRLPSP